MNEFFAGQFDIAVVGAGHAGIEAALAAARLGLETILFTINISKSQNHISYICTNILIRILETTIFSSDCFFYTWKIRTYRLPSCSKEYRFCT